MDILAGILAALVVAATPLIFAAIGELVVERAGVLNLGVEGIMIIGAIAGFAGTLTTGSPFLGFLFAVLCSSLLAFLFGILTQTLLANQVATGLALTIFGLGVSALVGQGYTGNSLPTFPRLQLPFLSDIPVLGAVLFSQDVLVYLSIALTTAVWWTLGYTRLGLILRAVGENHDASHSLGYPVVRIRYVAIVFGGACAGLGGAYLTIVQTPIWVEGMTAGRGWIALAIIVFAAWRPWRALLGAYLFGGFTILQLHAQGFGVSVSPQYLAMIPYAVTIFALVLISSRSGRAGLSAPASLSRTFYAAR